LPSPWGQSLAVRLSVNGGRRTATATWASRELRVVNNTDTETESRFATGQKIREKDENPVLAPIFQRGRRPGKPAWPDLGEHASTAYEVLRERIACQIKAARVEMEMCQALEGADSPSHVIRRSSCGTPFVTQSTRRSHTHVERHGRILEVAAGLTDFGLYSLSCIGGSAWIAHVRVHALLSPPGSVEK